MRNVIERIFGVIKARWRVLVLPIHFDMDLQARVPAALCALHNFILFHDPTDLDEWKKNLDKPDTEHEDPSPGRHIDPEDEPDLGEISDGFVTNDEKLRAEAKRDRIAQEMWVQYMAYIAEHRHEMEAYII